MKTFAQIVEKIAPHITEMLPWDVEDYLKAHPDTLIVDILETHEYDTMHIKDSLNVPRGILENACEWDFEETEPELVEARHRPIVLVCRSGNRTVLAAHTLQEMGYEQVISLKTGLRGWNDYEQPLQDEAGRSVDLDDADEYFTARLLPEQMKPKDWVD